MLSDWALLAASEGGTGSGDASGATGWGMVTLSLLTSSMLSVPPPPTRETGVSGRKACRAKSSQASSWVTAVVQNKGGPRGSPAAKCWGGRAPSGCSVGNGPVEEPRGRA